jgi:hypothetical protein
MFILGLTSLIPVNAQEDLIYVAVDPCRIVDTREAGGAITANDFRNFLVSGSLGELAVQGGKTDCLNPKAGQDPLAISAYVVAVPATGSTAGVLTAYPSDHLPPPVGAGSTVNFAAGQVIGNTTNITLCDQTSCPIDGEFAVLARNTDEHVVIDVQGYFYPLGGGLSLEDRVTALEDKLRCISKTSTNTDIFFEGCNVHVRNGDGTTDSINGYGNLIVGYNRENADSSDKTGSHTIVIGDDHNYSSYGGLVAGFKNTVSGESSSVTGGRENTASGDYSNVSGGADNEAIGLASSVSGGGGDDFENRGKPQGNLAIGDFSSVTGGTNNWAWGQSSSVSGGAENRAMGTLSAIAGGDTNTATGYQATVVGGLGGVAIGIDSTVSGGNGNTATGGRSTVSGGRSNNAIGENATVSGGLSNTAVPDDSHAP